MNAIILAAGMGMRLRPLTNNVPKCLVSVCGTPMVERQILFLHEAGIHEITLVSGYQAVRLEYLKDRYGVDIVYNERFNSCNNIYSLYKVLDRFGDSWVVEGDVYMHGNCFTTAIQQSTYFAKWHDHYDNEWGLVTDAEDRLVNINIGSGQGCIMSGISFWTKADAQAIADNLLQKMHSDDYTNLFWDQSVVSLYPSLRILVRRFDDLYEIDTESELRTVEKQLMNIKKI